MQTWEVTFHDAHAWDEACDTDCHRKTYVLADDPLRAAIKAFCDIDSVKDDPDFCGYARDTDHWTQETSHDFWLDTDESECCLYPLTVRKVRYPKT